MNRLVTLLFRPPPDEPLRAAAKSMNLAVVPLMFMACGLYRVWATATTPFEEFTGTLLVVMFAMLWAICFGVLADQWRAVRKSG